MSDQPNTLEVEDLDMFVKLLLQWHTAKVDTLEHMLRIPQGFEVSFNGEAPQILEGDLHAGFTIGLTVALIELGQLPFVARVEDEPEVTHAAPDEVQ